MMPLEQLRKQLESESSDGLKLLSNPEDNPICSITLDDSIPGIVIVWKRYATSTQLRFIHEQIIRLLEKHGVGKILGDDTAIATIHAEDQEWIIKDWMPRAIAAGLKAAASKIPNSYFGKLSIESIQSEVPQGLILRTFDNNADARTWLRDSV